MNPKRSSMPARMLPRPLLVLVVAGLISVAPARAGVKISEIMYHPPQADLEFIELANDGDTIVDLSGWRFTDGVYYEFPIGAELAPGERVIVARHRLAAAAVTGIPAIEIYGEYRGALSDARLSSQYSMPSSTPFAYS